MSARGRVIKSDDAPSTGAAFSTTDVREEAQRLLEEARARAERILREAREAGDRAAVEEMETHRDQAREEGWSEGFARGMEEGRETALAELREASSVTVTALERLVQELEAERARLVRRAESGLVELALRAAGAVVAAELDLDDSAQRAARAAAGRAARLAAEQADVHLHLHPEDRPAVESLVETLSRDLGAALTLVDDDTVERGGAIARGPHGTVDATPSAALDEIVRALTEDGGDR